MRFTPCSEEEALGLIPDGLYKFLVKKAQDKISKAGNEYIALELDLFDAQNKAHKVFTNMSLPYMVKHFCEATGMPEKWESGLLCAKDCENRGGQCKAYTKKDSSGQYPPKTDIADYIVKAVDAAPPIGEPFNDSIPF